MARTSHRGPRTGTLLVVLLLALATLLLAPGTAQAAPGAAARTHEISGRVVSAEGTPIRLAVVQLWVLETAADGTRTETAGEYTMTAGDGQFALSVPDGQTVTLSVIQTDYVASTLEGHDDVAQDAGTVVAGSQDVGDVALALAPEDPALPRTMIVRERGSVAGNAAVGARLRVVEPEFEQAPDALTVQWLRDGLPVDGADQSVYRVSRDDLGHELSVRVTGHRAGYLDESWTSWVSVVERARPAVRLQLARQSTASRHRVVVGLALRGHDSSRAVRLVVRDGRRVVRAVRVPAGADHARVALPRLAPGRHRLRAVVPASDTQRGATSPVRVLRVR